MWSFRSEECVPIAVSMTGQKLLGVPIIVEITETEKNRIAEEAALAQKRSKELSVEAARIEPTSLYVSGISYSTDEAKLRAVFRQFGPVDSVQYVRDDAGFFKGNAVVRMSNAREAMQAVEKLNGFILSNSVISVSTTERRPESNALGKEGCLWIASSWKTCTILNWKRSPIGMSICWMRCWGVQKFGNIVDSCIPLTKKGEILIRFDAESSAKMAQLNLDGRWFSERKIVAKQIDAETFHTVNPGINNF